MNVDLSTHAAELHAACADVRDGHSIDWYAPKSTAPRGRERQSARAEKRKAQRKSKRQRHRELGPASR